MNTMSPDTRVLFEAAAAVRPGVASRARFSLLDAEGVPVTDVVESHERPVHLIVVRRDLEHFQHLHPSPGAEPGSFEVAMTVPEPGEYLMFFEVARATGQQVIERLVLDAGATPAASLEPSDLTQRAGSHEVSLMHPRLRAGEEAEFVLRVTDARTGHGVSDLRPYLGAAAHVVILDQAGERFAHAHGSPGRQAGGEHERHGGHQAAGGHEAVAATFGPVITFSHVFPAPGLYRVWAQYAGPDGSVQTASFVVRVES